MLRWYRLSMKRKFYQIVEVACAKVRDNCEGGRPSVEPILST